jgi:glycosyltransferase involved in cell wall biosynthesis
MRVGIDCRLPFYELGGISQYVIHLIRELGELDKTNHYTIFHSRKDGNNYLPTNVSNYFRRNLWTPCHHRLEKWSLAAEITPNRIDILHSPDFIPPAFGAKTRIITIHDLNFLYYPEYLSPESRRYYLDQIRWAAVSANHIIADSECTRQDLINDLDVPASKVTTVHLAANPIYSLQQTPEMIEETLQRFSLSAGFVLFVGTLSPRKNVTTLLKAFHLLGLEQGFDLPLVIVGKKGYQSSRLFEEIKELNLESMVKHLDNVEDEQLAALYSAASVLGMPSHYEGFGLPPLEAMHCGCPIVASNRSSLPEIVGEAGIYCEPNDHRSWAEALLTVITDSDKRQKMIDAGHKQSEKFTWSSTAKKTLKLYLE